jgi:pimeloyl-ACP methyl ester carboxylesterase
LGKLLLFASTTAAGGWLLYSRFGVNRRMTLPPAIDADQERFVGENTRFLSYYVDRKGTGRPLVLIHSINAAGSAYEMRPLFEQYRGKRPVYALDLPGFGFSERADREYTPTLYKEAILDLLRMKVGEPADVVALSLGSEFAAMAALEQPDLFHTLTLISPTGFSERSGPPKNDGLLAFLRNPLWSQAVFDLLVTKGSIQYFLQMSFAGVVDPGLAAYDYLTTHQPGARHAPLHFVSGQLFTPTVRVEVYEKLTLPVLVIHDRDGFVRFDHLPATLRACPNWQAKLIVPTKGLPQFEKLTETTAALDEFWGATSP